jgi:ElaA protein
MSFVVKGFEELSAYEWHEVLGLRAEVFVVEQNCAYKDPDEKDPKALHVLFRTNNTLSAYARILPPGISYAEPSIGRVVVSHLNRGTGLGKNLMKFSAQKTRELFPGKEIVISAQCYLRKFYSDLNFNAEGDEYNEDGIPHVKMRHPA